MGTAGSRLGGRRCRGAGGGRPAADRRCVGRNRQGRRRLSVPDRHDAAGRGGAASRPVRLAGRRRGKAGARLGGAAVPARLSCGYGGHHLHVERCHRRCAHAGGGGGAARGPGEGTAALPAGLRLHRQRRLVRAADQQSGQSGDLRQPHAAAAAMAAALCPALAAVDRRHLRSAAGDPGACVAPARRHRHRHARSVVRRAHRGRRDRADGNRADGGLRAGLEAGSAHRHRRRRHRDRRAAGRARRAVADAARHLLGRAAAGGRAVRAGAGARSCRADPPAGGDAARSHASLPRRRGVGKRRRAGARQQRDEQPARRADRRHRRAGGAARRT
jgi:hypothetical protein